MTVPTITVLYSCVACGVHRASVAVAARAEGEDVVYWVEQTMAGAIARDHAVRSPHCAARAMTEALIPISGADEIGGALKQ